MKRHVFLVLIFAMAASPSLSQQKVREKDLALKYQDWLKLTAYVILPQEKDVFLKLENDRDRDIFIASFWKQRDPTPGTEENEYRIELVKRFDHANKEFRKGAARPGWMTDMGKFYIILGPPNSMEDYSMRPEIYPAKVWYYFGDTTKGLPTYFALVFYKKGGAGEYRLFDQSMEGPTSLLIDKSDIGTVDVTSNYQAAYQKLQESVPEIAPLTISMIPGDPASMYESTLRATFILRDILESPKKDVNPSYARHFLDFKGYVSTEYLTNMVDCEATVAILHDPVLGLNFLHYSVSPKRLSIDFYEPRNQYYCNYTVDVSLRRGEKIFFQESKEFPFYFDPEHEATVRNNGIAIEDSFPLVAGASKLIILLKNSVGKEFSVIERDIVCPEPPAAPAIDGVVVGYKVEGARVEVHAPFALAGSRLYVDAKNTFAADEEIAYLVNLLNVSREIWEKGELRATVQGLGKDNLATRTFSLKLAGVEYRQNLSLAQTLPAAELKPDYYEMKISLIDGGGRVLGEKPAQFVVSPGPVPGRPVSIAKSLPISGAYFYSYILAEQYDKTGRPDQAEAFYRKAAAAAPQYYEGVAAFAGFLVRRQKFDEALKFADTLAAEPKMAFDRHLIRGQAWQGLGQYDKAVEALLEANKIYDSDTRVLNALGFSLVKTGDKVQARRALATSLRLNPDQPEIKKLVDSLDR